MTWLVSVHLTTAIGYSEQNVACSWHVGTSPASDRPALLCGWRLHSGGRGARAARLASRTTCATCCAARFFGARDSGSPEASQACQAPQGRRAILNVVGRCGGQQQTESALHTALDEAAPLWRQTDGGDGRPRRVRLDRGGTQEGWPYQPTTRQQQLLVGGRMAA